MRVPRVQTLIENNGALLNLLSELSDESRSATGAKASGFLNQILSFETYFDVGLRLLVAIFERCEFLATKLQGSNLSVADCQRLVADLRITWVRQREECKLDAFWQQITVDADELVLEKPELPRARRPPRRLDGGAAPHVFLQPKYRFRKIYY